MTDRFEADRSPALESWWELSYARYLTIPRSIIQSMPIEWQDKFAALLGELDDTFDWRPSEGRYWVQLKDRSGHFVADPLCEYRHVPRLTPEHVKEIRFREGAP